MCNLDVSDKECQIIVSALYSKLKSLDDVHDYVKIINLISRLNEKTGQLLKDLNFDLIESALDDYLDICYIDDFDEAIKVQKKIIKLKQSQ